MAFKKDYMLGDKVVPILYCADKLGLRPRMEQHTVGEAESMSECMKEIKRINESTVVGKVSYTDIDKINKKLTEMDKKLDAMKGPMIKKKKILTCEDRCM